MSGKSQQDWASLERGMSSGGCRWRWDGGNTITVECLHSKHVWSVTFGFKGLLKIISASICLGNVYGETNFPCLCFLQIFALLQFSLSELE